MLIDFEIENFLSYRHARKLSLVASPIKELPANLFKIEELGLTLVRSAAIYGANASGKSNLLAAMDSLSRLLAAPMERGMTSHAGRSPFALDSNAAKSPTRFRVHFLVAGILYDYALSVTGGKVVEERLIVHPRGRPQEWFHRTGNSIEFRSSYLKGQKQPLRVMTPPDVPLLAVGAAFGHPQLYPPAEWLRVNLGDRFGTIDSPSEKRRYGDNRLGDTARQCANDNEFRTWVNSFLCFADLGIEEIEIEITESKSGTIEPEQGADGSTGDVLQQVTQEVYRPLFIHSGDEGMKAKFPLRGESQGTRRLFAILSPLYEVLDEGGLAIIDELGSSLHPSLTRKFIRAFHDARLNPKGAQLVFTTHDTSMLNGQIFRRDQIWFTEKDANGATDLYSLHDIKGVREDESFENGYIRGRYGAIPFFGSFDFPQVKDCAGAVGSKT